MHSGIEFLKKKSETLQMDAYFQFHFWVCCCNGLRKAICLTSRLIEFAVDSHENTRLVGLSSPSLAQSTWLWNEENMPLTCSALHAVWITRLFICESDLPLHFLKSLQLILHSPSVCVYNTILGEEQVSTKSWPRAPAIKPSTKKVSRYPGTPVYMNWIYLCDIISHLAFNPITLMH